MNATQSVIIRSEKILKRIEIDHIIAVTCDSYCSTFLLNNNEHFTSSKLLKQVEEILPPPIFIRVSRNAIVNLLQAVELNLDNRKLQMRDGKNFEVYIRRLSMVKKLFQNSN